MGLFLSKYYSLCRENKLLQDNIIFLQTECNNLKHTNNIITEENTNLIKLKNSNQIEIDKYKYAIDNYIKRIDYLDNLLKEYNIMDTSRNLSKNKTNKENPEEHSLKRSYSNFINEFIDKFKV